MVNYALIGQQVDFSQRHKFKTVIGSRRASVALRDVASYFSWKFVESGFTVVSGLAEGIDTAAHLGALKSDATHPRTVAIVSTAPSELYYPAANRQLAERIKQHGAILHPFVTKAKWERGVRFGQPQKRLVERDILQASLSSEVYVVSDDPVISGGSRWVLNYAKYLGVSTYRIDSVGNIHPDPDFVVEKKLIPWELELAWEDLTRLLQHPCTCMRW